MLRSIKKAFDIIKVEVVISGFNGDFIFTLFHVNSVKGDFCEIAVGKRIAEQITVTKV